MSDTTSSEQLRSEDLRAMSPTDNNVVTIRNDSQYDALIYVRNGFWGPKSLGLGRAGQTVNLPTNVNVDAYAQILNDATSRLFVVFPDPVLANKKKINLTPGQTYSLSDFND